MTSKTEVLYVEWKTLQNADVIDPAPDSEVEGVLLVGVESVLEFESHHSTYGHDDTEVFPAFHNGDRCWIRRDTWDAAFGYSASGTQETILPFEDGVKLLIEQGVFTFKLDGE